MPDMVCQRNYTLRTLQGHTIEFKANEPTYVPPECIDAALAVNIIPAEGGFAKKGDKAAIGPIRVAAMSPELREAMLLHAIDELVRENDVNTFDAGGRPKASTIKERSNLEINATERTKLWDKYRDMKSSNTELPRPKNFHLVLDAQQASTQRQLLEQAELFGMDTNEMRGWTLREIKGAVVQAAIAYDPTLSTAGMGTLDED